MVHYVHVVRAVHTRVLRGPMVLEYVYHGTIVRGWVVHVRVPWYYEYLRTATVPNLVRTYTVPTYHDGTMVATTVARS